MQFWMILLVCDDDNDDDGDIHILLRVSSIFSLY